ncbi:hypothetical protein [Sphingomonas sp.]|uniref:hypothetical protein n=1 Tax=Sphingomonas sp. TaxID=28214 RepID=UPI00307F97BA
MNRTQAIAPARIAPPSLRAAPAYLTPPAADAAIALMDALGVEPRSPQERIVALVRDMAGDASPPSTTAAPRPRLGAPNPARRRPMPVHPLERTGAAVNFLRLNGVSVAREQNSLRDGMLWNVSGFGRSLSATEVIELAIAKGMAR